MALRLFPPLAELIGPQGAWTPKLRTSTAQSLTSLEWNYLGHLKIVDNGHDFVCSSILLLRVAELEAFSRQPIRTSLGFWEDVWEVYCTMTVKLTINIIGTPKE